MYHAYGPGFHFQLMEGATNEERGKQRGRRGVACPEDREFRPTWTSQQDPNLMPLGVPAKSHCLEQLGQMRKKY